MTIINIFFSNSISSIDMNLLCVGISHHTAPLDVRERLWFLLKKHAKPCLYWDLWYGECVLFSTCNRMKYMSWKRITLFHQKKLKNINRTEIRTRQGATLWLFTLTAGDAARHLFRVAAGIDSMVLGDVQISCTSERRFSLANELGTAGFFMNRLFSARISAGKRRVQKRDRRWCCLRQLCCGRYGKKILMICIRNLRCDRAGETADLTATHLHLMKSVQTCIHHTHTQSAETAAAKQGVYLLEWLILSLKAILISSSKPLNLKSQRVPCMSSDFKNTRNKPCSSHIGVR